MAGSLIVAESEKPMNAIRNQWQVHFARFLASPSLPSTCPSLIPISRNRSRRGSWISTASPTASLSIVNDPSVSDAILTVSLREKIIEEHYISKLHLSWPQVSCVSGFPARGCRAVFLSYKDSEGEIQKFALRFSTNYEVESFIYVMKENLKETNENEPLQSDLGSVISTQSEFISTNRLPSSTCEEELNTMTPVDIYTPQMAPSLENEAEQQSSTQETLLNSNSEGNFPVMPPSFTSLLSNFCSKAEQDQPKVPEEIDLKAKIAGFMEDSSFQDMLVKVERIIGEIGYDMTL